MDQVFLDSIHKAHFVGIGGIGVSALARLMLANGVSVTGSDRTPSLITEKLEAEGAKVFFEHEQKNLPDALDLVVYSPAIADDNPELCTARERGVLTHSYPGALGKISRGMRTIAISGTHGKTTTTAMIAGVLVDTKRSPTVIVGSLLKGSGSNFVGGTSDLFVVEACEYKRSFLHLSPEILVITNIDNDHLDYYGTIEGVQKAFAEFVAKVPRSGAIVCDPSDPLVKPVLQGVVTRIVDYTKEFLTSPLLVPGEHNKKNAQVALAVARLLDVSEKDAMRSLAMFEGTWRRMEYKGEMMGVPIYDDYAHHPTEVRATLQGFRAQYPASCIRVVFQPHLYSRTKLLLYDFAKSFSDADEVIVAPIYVAREKPDPAISGEILMKAISEHHNNVRFCGDLPAIKMYLRETMQKGDIMVTMGAGDVYKIGEELVSDSL